MAKRKKTDNSETTNTVGRQVSEETQNRMDYIKTRVVEEPGVLSAELARELDMNSLACSQLGDRMVKAGVIDLFKLANGQRSYYLPAVLKKKLPSLEKQRDKELEERSAAKAQPRPVKPKTKPAGAEKKSRKTKKAA